MHAEWRGFAVYLCLPDFPEMCRNPAKSVQRPFNHITKKHSDRKENSFVFLLLFYLISLSTQRNLNVQGSLSTIFSGFLQFGNTCLPSSNPDVGVNGMVEPESCSVYYEHLITMSLCLSFPISKVMTMKAFTTEVAKINGVNQVKPLNRV